MDDHENLIESARAVLESNDQGYYIIPSKNLYPHQWLWDSCFIAIGLSNYDIDRAQTEILSLLRGQWSNGMLPHIIFASGEEHHRDKDIWRSWLSPNSPDGVSTSGITQPPVITEAAVRVGKKLPQGERRIWYKTVFPALVAYHEWLYRERDPHSEGLVLQVHPWETGLDNTPPWMSELRKHSMPLWVRMIVKSPLNYVPNLIRRDTRFVQSDERLTTEDALGLFVVQRRLRRKAYEINEILPHGLFAIEDLTFNCILIRANELLKDMAKLIGKDLPENLLASFKKAKEALGELWDPYTNQYYSRNFITHKLIKEPSIASLMPLYAGCIDEKRAQKLISTIKNQHLFGPSYPLPTVPVNSPWFHEKGYWQGSTWINTNWLVMDGLKRLGYTDHFEALKNVSLSLVSQSGMYEYFSPLTGDPAGSDNFSWTAALVIDLLSNK